MPSPSVRGTRFSLDPSPGLFYISSAFVLIGLSTQLLGDFASGLQVAIINDLVSYSAFLVVLFLVLVRVASPGMGLLVNLMETLRNLYFALVWSWTVGPEAMGNDWTQEIILLTCLFGAVIGLWSQKFVALLAAAMALLLQFSYIQLFQEDEVARQRFMLSSLVMTGCLLVVYFYRSTLERVVADLGAAYAETRELKEKAEELEVDNRPFVTFGQNTAGLVHDFRNDVNAMSIAIQTLQLRNGRGRPPDPQDMDRIARSLENLTHRINMVRFVTEAGREGPAEYLDLRIVVDSAVYPFVISPELRHRIEFEIDSIGDVVIRGNRLAYLQLFENIIRNSCEALLEHPPAGGAMARINVVIARYGRQVEMEFRDNGPGIPDCRVCRRRVCLDCPNFAVGKTTKKFGSGIGMINIFRVVKSLGGHIRIDSTEAGTSLLVTIPVPDGGSAP
jgi:signal transduction histidine kinase